MHLALQRIYTRDGFKVENGWRYALTQAYSQLPSTAFIPIKSLEQKNADPWMLFIMNSRPVFAEPVNDPVFRADVPFSTIQAYQTGDHTGDFTVYLPSHSCFSSSLF
jgi:hypothetical protein